MHEVSIMEQTLEIALNHAHKQGASQIHRIKLKVGELSGVVPEALKFAFDVVTQNTIAQSATLEVETIPVECYCSNCQENFYPSDLIHLCPHCGQLSREVRQGKELELASLEVS